MNAEANYDQTKEACRLWPSPNGADNWSHMSFNPSTGLVYIPTTTDGSRTFSLETDFVYKPGERNTGILRTGFGPARPAPAAIGPVPPEGQHFALVAWDPVTQKERWRTPGGGGVGGGTVTTASNLVFQVINDGRVMAYSADKGEKLLEIQTGLRGGMGPPITYMLDGKQYVALMGGTGLAPGAGPGGGGAGAAAAGVGGGRGAEPLPPDLAGAAAQPQAAAAPAPNAAPAGPVVRPKLLVFVLDGKGTLPVTTN